MNNKWIKIIAIFTVFALVVGWVLLLNVICGGNCSSQPEQTLITSVSEYKDNLLSVRDQLLTRIQRQPFNLVALFLFACAIAHTFFCHYFTRLSEKLKERNRHLKSGYVETFAVEILHFLGEVEVAFGIWVIPLFFSLTYVFGWTQAVNYMDGLRMTEPMFVVVIMALAATAPIIKFAERIMKYAAKLGNESLSAWWWAILTIGPIAGSAITEPAAMTISALLLAAKFYKYKPKPMLAYGTLGLLFVNISVGGVFTHFAAPPVLMVSGVWKWNTLHMITNFGWKAFLGILIANSCYYFFFRKEFQNLENKRKDEKKEKNTPEIHIPYWITCTHLLFLVIVVICSHHPILFVGAFLLFLGFYQATQVFQQRLDLRSPVLVGCFLASLVIHGSLQGWWIEPVLGKAPEGILQGLALVLTSFNDNAAITFLATLIPNYDDARKYAIVAGAVAGGGLTIIANAPNPAGQAILGKFFHYGISAVGLFCGALFPTAVMAACFYFL